MILKLEFGALGAGALLALSPALDNALQGVVLIAAALAALGYIWLRVVAPLAHFMRRTARGVDLLFELADWRRDVDRRLDAIEQKAAADVVVSHRVEQERRRPE